MQLTAYRLSTEELPLPIRCAPSMRDWMNATRGRSAYRCLPMTVANTHGWEMLSPCTFEAMWNGTTGTDGVTIVRLGGDGRLPLSHFGDGILTFHPKCLFRTEGDHALFVSGPLNSPKDGIASLSGIVETSWLPFTFTMNWAFTRPGAVVRFDEGEPVCHFFPVSPAVVESTVPIWDDLSNNPEIEAEYARWASSRGEWNAAIDVDGSESQRAGWQKFYVSGTNADGARLAERSVHRTRIRTRPFMGACRADTLSGGPEAELAEPDRNNTADSHR